MINSETKYYTYGLINPLKPSKESYIGGISLHEYEFFYFGFTGREKRLDEHLNCKKADPNLHKKNTIKKIRKAGLEPTFVKILVDVDKQTAIGKEIEMIAYYGRADLGLGPLTNMTDGGEGITKIVEDLTGRIFGKLKVLHIGERAKNSHIQWLCECECGNEKLILGSSLRSKRTNSCGCYRSQEAKRNNTKNKTTRRKINPMEYVVWQSVKQRCYDSKCVSYEYYGGRDIKVCDRWLESFENFYEDMGERPTDKHKLGRLDIQKNYEPSNCKWTLKTLRLNIGKNSRYLTVDGETKTMKEWSIISGIRYGAIKDRVNRGWEHKEAIFKPTGKYIREKELKLLEEENK